MTVPAAFFGHKLNAYLTLSSALLRMLSRNILNSKSRNPNYASFGIYKTYFSAITDFKYLIPFYPIFGIGNNWKISFSASKYWQK